MVRGRLTVIASPEYLPGQWVWLSTRNLRLNLPCKKLSPRFVGPYKILRQITPVSFRLALPRHLRISPTFHVSLLKPATPPTEEERGDSSRPSSQSNAVQTSQAIVVEGEEAYLVHQLLDSRRRRGHLQYLVDWEGCSPEERSWVNSRDILDPMLTQEFHCNHPEKPAPRARGRPRRRQHPRAGSRSQGGGGGLCYGFQFPGFLHLSITSALSRVLAQCILPPSMLHLRSDCLSPVLYQRSLPSLYLLHSPCRLCEVLPLYVCMSERFSFYSVYLLSLTHAELTLSICLQPALRPPTRSGF